MTALDLAVWQNAPQQRTALYLSTYIAISRAIQTELRQSVGEWIFSHTETLSNYRALYPILLYRVTIPYTARTTTAFTYDIQDNECVKRAFASGAFHLRKYLATLPTAHLKQCAREKYFSYRAASIANSVRANRRPFYRLLSAESSIVNAFIAFGVRDIRTLGTEQASIHLQRKVTTQLSRMSDLFDFSDRAELLIKIATDTLVLCANALPPAPDAVVVAA